MERICVYAGSSFGFRTGYREVARHLGLVLARLRITLVYGGGSVGLMGVLADATLEAGGEVIGVIPKPLATRELVHEGVGDMRIVSSMHERKSLMAELSDAFIALPGGLGTLEELFETLTWAQLGLHRKPCGLLDVSGYYQRLVELLDHCRDEGFVKSIHRSMLLVDDDPAALIERFSSYKPPDVPKWIYPSEA